MKQLGSLDVWRGAQDLARSVYLLTMQAPLSRHFALADQIRRAAVSIPANIAEGYALGSTAQFVRYLRISLGSTAELQCHLELAEHLGLVSAKEVGDAMALCIRVISIVSGAATEA